VRIHRQALSPVEIQTLATTPTAPAQR